MSPLKSADMSAHSKMRASSPGESSLIRVIRGRESAGIRVDSRWISRSKNFKKVEKKACQVSESSINEEKLGDKPADFPFKNILKKVKKKLVRLKKIQ